VELARDWRTEPEDEQPARERPRALPMVAARPLGPLRSVVARTFDLAGAIAVLALAWPLLLGGILVVLTGGGRPVFFGHVRVGRGRRLFRCWKLRTMRSDAEQRLLADGELHQRYVGNGFKLPTAQDPRVLPGGRWLRRLYLDELPQLWNVLRGDMSLVGPRPVVPGELELFGEHADGLLSRRPGLFGEWTSRGRRRPPYPERVRVEMELIDDPAVARTGRILARSLMTVLRGQGDEG